MPQHTDWGHKTRRNFIKIQFTNFVPTVGVRTKQTNPELGQEFDKPDFKPGLVFILTAI